MDEAVLTVCTTIRPPSTLIYLNSDTDEGVLIFSTNIKPSSTIIYGKSEVFIAFSGHTRTLTLKTTRNW